MFSPSAHADEGMWLFNDFPSAQVLKAHGFSPNRAWLDHVQRSSVRLAGGCSGSFVSGQGLVMTNHHCARGCLESLSTPKNDLLVRGFSAKANAQELACGSIEINQLTQITDVTARLNKATAGLTGAEFYRALKAESARIESECATGPQLRCDVVTLFHGAKYNLYQYRRFQDVRLVFAPEQEAATFGGYPDNFNFPRYGFDVSFLRIYDQGKPASTPDHFDFAPVAAKAGDLVFVSGNPGSTQRGDTVAQLNFSRDVSLPTVAMYTAELMGRLKQYETESAEHFRVAQSSLRGVENNLKVTAGRIEALAEPALMAKKLASEQRLRAYVAQDPTGQQTAAAWDAIARALDEERREFLPYFLGEQTFFQSSLFRMARDLVRATVEVQKPNGDRLREYTDAQLPTLEQRLFSTAPVERAMEQEKLIFALTRLRDLLGVDAPFVQSALGKNAPEQLAKQLISQTRLTDPKVRRALYEGGISAIQASKDALIQFALRLDPETRKLRKAYEDNVESVVKQNSELIARARVAMEGTGGYPDATFSPRLSFGTVEGWVEKGHSVAPVTTMAGLFARATGAAPFALPASWRAAQKTLNPQTPMNLCTSDESVGGNSGSPLINRAGEVVGLIFDGNLPSLAGAYAYDPAKNRAVAVHSEALLEGLSKVYRADALVQELKKGTGYFIPH